MNLYQRLNATLNRFVPITIIGIIQYSAFFVIDQRMRIDSCFSGQSWKSGRKVA